MATKADALLQTYREKRDFAKTKEPDGGRAGLSRDGLAFVVQKHEATRLHYDFRVEWEGVLKSWAVTRGPSLDPADKRLAVRTEDHPLDYGDFEGTIPKGAYGGGTVMLWDRGYWEPQGDAEKGLASGNLKMILHGKRMTGRWALIRMKPRAKEKRENWLLIKEKDEIADPDRDILTAVTSVKTDRTMAAIAAGDKEWTRPTVSPSQKAKGKPAAKEPPKQKAPTGVPRKSKAKPAATSTEPPAFRPLQLATLVSEAPSGKDWLHELKYDGYRVEIAVGGGRSRLYTRTGLDWTDRFAAILPAVGALSCDSALIDGEVVAFDDDGKTDFSELQKRLKGGGDLACLCFDILSLDGTDLAKEPLRKRKAILKALLDGQYPEKDRKRSLLLYSDHVTGNGPAMVEQIRGVGLEGVVSKKADAPYSGGRGTAWVKTKVTRRQEFVIGGFSPSAKKGRAFSSILVGVREEGELRYRGRVGSGFDDATLEVLGKSFSTLSTKASPFADLPAAIARISSFVEPKLVAEVDFAELTGEGHVRHGVFKGLREDKDPKDIRDETPAPSAEDVEPKRPSADEAGKTTPAAKRTRSASKAVVTGITLTHPDRVIFEAPAVTKLDLARYYEAAAPRMLLHLADRPLSLVRCPGGRQGKCFFQKHASDGFPSSIKALAIREKDGSKADYMVVDDAAGIVGAVQMNALEFHVWGSTRGSLEKPDRLVFDLDPDESLGFDDVKAAAFDLKDVLETLGLQTFAMVTGGKGVHVVAPLAKKNGWDEVKGFSRDVAVLLAVNEPDRFVATMSKAKRKGRIFIDWLRNERGSTAIAPYSTRSRDGGPVAVPVGWEELGTLDAANSFRPSDVEKRLLDADPWEAYSDVRQSLTQKVLKSVKPG